MGNYWSSAHSPDDLLPLQRKYGWRPDLPDHRDLLFKFNEEVFDRNLEHVDHRNQCPPVFDQGSLGSCTAQSLATAYLFDEMKQENADTFTPSRLFIYYNERSVEGTTDIDNGASIRDGIKSINKTGVCHESLWPYDVSKFAQTPPSICYQDAKEHKSLKYYRIKQRRSQLKSALQTGYPVVCGIAVYESMETPHVAETGLVSMPEENEKLLGGHCIVLVGYDNEKKLWLFRNSWGSSWGNEGYGYLPYQYLSNRTKLASDFWIIQTVTRE